MISGSLGKAAWICSSNGGVTFRASYNTIPQILRFSVSSLITNLTLNIDGSSSFGTNTVSTGAIVASGTITSPTLVTAQLQASGTI